MMMKIPAHFNGIEFERTHDVYCSVDVDGNLEFSQAVDDLDAKIAANVADQKSKEAAKQSALTKLGITLDELKALLG